MNQYQLPVCIRLGLLSGFISLSVLMACQKKSDKSFTNTLAEDPYFNRSVGAPIDSALANRYKRNLAQQLRTSHSTITTAYYLPASILRTLINNDKSVGILFYYGQDTLNKVYLEPIGVDSKAYVMPTATVTTNSGVISWKEAKQFRERFKRSNPTSTWGYFWGSNAIQRLLNQGTKEVRIELGLKEDGAQTLLFSNAADATPALLEDRVMNCPSYCATDEEVLK